MESHQPSATSVATFPRRADADAAIHALHHAGFHHTWLGLTRTVDENTFGGAGGTVGAGRERVEPAETTIARWLHRDDERTLYDVLRDHGVLEEDARVIDGSVLEGNCVLVVEDARSPSRIAKIVRECGGEMRAGAVEQPAEPDPLAAPRREAARRDRVCGELDINAARREREPLEGNRPTVREDVFVRRLPSSDKPAPY